METQHHRGRTWDAEYSSSSRVRSDKSDLARSRAVSADLTEAREAICLPS